MIVLYPTLLAIAAALFLRRGRRQPAGGTGWRWFAAWTAAGAVFSFSFLAGLSIGLFFVPLAAALLITVARMAPRLGEATGFVAGLGLTLLLVAYRNRDYTPCGPHARFELPAGMPAGTTVSCGGIDPSPWLVAGLAVGAAAALTYAGLKRRRDCGS